MAGLGYEWGEAGVRPFAETYGVLEKITTIQPADNACSKARVTTQVKRRPGASPLLFGQFLMGLGAFISLEDIACDLPTYTEEVIGVEMDPPLRAAYRQLEEDVKRAQSLGAMIYLVKADFSIQDIVGKIKETIGKKNQ